MATTTFPAPASLTTQSFAIEGMTCGGCASGVRGALSRLNGVSGATVDLGSATATVAYDSAVVSPADFQQAVADAGFALKAHGTTSDDPRSKGGCCGG